MVVVNEIYEKWRARVIVIGYFYFPFLDLIREFGSDCTTLERRGRGHILT
jgi:hypothetical protein